VRLLTQALRHGRLPHGVLVVGPPSTEVRPLCDALTAYLLCQKPNPELFDPCGACPGCARFAAHTHASVTYLAANGRGVLSVNEVRGASAKLYLRPPDGGINIMRIDSAQNMQKPAQNALLKTLEEPPGHGCIILGATSVGLLLPTILSRVARVVLGTPNKSTSVAALAASGIDSPYAELLAPQVGADTALAHTLMAAGFVHVVDTLREALTLGLSVWQSQAFAQKLGDSPEQFDMTLAVIEVLLRDALAELGGAPEGLMTQPGVANILTQLPGERIGRGIDQLMTLRRQRKLNINRAQALEGLFVTLNHRGIVV
jgi:hypothetical protein